MQTNVAELKCLCFITTLPDKIIAPPILLVIIVIECITVSKAIKYSCKHADTWKNLFVLRSDSCPRRISLNLNIYI